MDLIMVYATVFGLIVLVVVFVVAFRRIMAKAGYSKSIQYLSFLPLGWIFLIYIVTFAGIESRGFAIFAIGVGIPCTILGLALFLAFATWPVESDKTENN